MSFAEPGAKNKKLRTVEFEAPQFFAFRFTFLVFVTSLIVLPFIIGCPPVKPEPPKLESPRVEPLKAEPNEVEIPEAEPNEVEIPDVEPNEVKIPEVEPNEVNIPGVEPNKVEPNEVKPSPKVSFHDKCADILTNFVNDKGMVNYKMLKRNRPKLKKILDEFAKLDPNEYNSWPKEDKIAFWVNAYNMNMLKIIVNNYPIKSSRWERIFRWPPSSVRYIDKDIGGISKQKFIVKNEEFTLRGIERRFFREKFDEPRVFFTLFRATLSSPPLRNEPYYGYKLDKQLDDQTKKFLSSNRAFKIDRKKQRVYLSAILQPTWFGKEFGSKYATGKKFKDQPPIIRAILNFITNYISEQDTFFLERQNYSVKYIGYDWRLNDGS